MDPEPWLPERRVKASLPGLDRGNGAGRGFMMGKVQGQGGTHGRGCHQQFGKTEADTALLPDSSPSKGHQAAHQPGIVAAAVVV